MIEKQCLVVLIMLYVSFMGFGQISITGLGAGNTYTQDFNTLANTGTSTTVPSGWGFSESGTNANTNYTAGTGSGTAGDTYSFGLAGNTERSFGGLLSGSLIPIIGVSFTNNAGATVTDLIISYTGEQWRLGATGRVDQLDFQYSLNATSLATGTWTDENNLDFLAPITSGTVGTLDGNLVANRTSKSFTITGLSIADGSTFYFRWNDFNAPGSDDGLGVDDFSIYVNGITDDVDWCNVQFPESDTIALGNTRPVYARAWEVGVTDAIGQGTGLDCWIGYSLTDATSISDFTSPDWTWVLATFNGDFGNNDEFIADIGANIPTIGTYYYVSRFQLNGGPYRYGGIDVPNAGHFWDGLTYLSGILTVNARTPDRVNLQFPGGSNSITTGTVYDVFAQIYEPGITDTHGSQGANIQTWIGVSSDNTDPATWPASAWFSADYNSTCLVCDTEDPLDGNDDSDEYFVDIGSTLPIGTYYYASRFTIDDPAVYYYGGYNATLPALPASQAYGGFWDSIYDSDDPSGNQNGELIVTPAPCNDLFISEYIEGSSNNKCLEIYNPTGSPINLGNYDIEVYANGSGTASTYSLSGTLASGDTFVICNPSASPSILALSDDTSGIISFNGNDAVALVNSGSIIDVLGEIGYDPGDGIGWVGGSASTVNRTLIRKSNIQFGDYVGSNTFDPNSEWTVFPIDDISDLGYHFSDCIPSSELQLQVLLPAPTNIICGYTYDFGNVVLNSNNDVVLRIQNLGTNTLDITDLSFLTGAHYSLVSPPGIPFSIGGNSYQDFTIRFNPSNIGIFLDTLTITNSDASESICEINLTGISVTNCDTTSVVLAAQDFELAGDTWGYTADHLGSDFPNNWGIVSSLSSIFSAESGTQFWGITDLERSGHENQTHELSFSYSGLLGENNVQFSFYYYTIDLDATDSFDYEIFYDSVSQGTTNISANNDAWEQVLINIPSTVDEFDIIFYADLDAVNDQAGLDNFTLTSTSINTTTWDGIGWSSPPNLNTVAILDDDFDTASNGSFSACSLIINDGFTLNIADGNYAKVENNLTVNGNIVVQPLGSFVQNNDLGVVDGAVLSDKTKIVVNKLTAFANYWYEYTYWSSPVKGETIEDGLFESATNRRFLFNAQNYLDHCAESNNDNTCVPGFQDGIDDDNDDWQWVIGTTEMEPGVGYASTHNATIFGSTPSCPGCRIEYTFDGPFNNGVITVPVYRNDFDTNDTNSNFIGNPYPSAIDVDEFFDLNAFTINPAGALDGAIYLWSQDTAPSSTTNGNQVLNFSQSDYAIINAGVGETAGGDNNGDGIIDMNDKPNRFIPSGQGFFTSVSDMATVVDAPTNPDPNIKTANVIFNNSMRMADGTSNSQFFRTSGQTKSKKEANKIWVNLTSDNGVFSQILVGYVDGATHNFDGSYYDTTRNTGKYSVLYSIIQDSDNKFAIQGKAIEDINSDEVIKLGFETSINVATLYKLSIAQLEGDFLSSNPIYLKDNLLHKVHNLSESDYSFTSDVGEFKDRFEIMFQSGTLSDTEAVLNSNKLTIIELNDGRVQVKTNSHLNIKSVQILDILGRTLYQLKGSSTTEIYTLSHLSQSTYIAKVELSNGQVITKRAIKRY